jgi:hexosaminidase
VQGDIGSLRGGNMSKMILVPYPVKVNFLNGVFVFDSDDCILLRYFEKEELYDVAKRLQNILNVNLNLALPLMVERNGMYRSAISFVKDDSLSKEEYGIEIDSQNIKICYSTINGAFHAVSTLKQLILQYGKELPCMNIEDAPDFEARGIMLDISRDKIPTMETLFRLVDFMADLKLNQLQLYVEGFSFAYSTYPFVWQDGTPITGEEILELDRYCKKNCIELVPNQNCFGHMNKWLATSEFNSIAECPEGFEPPWEKGILVSPGTLDPQDRRSLELVENMIADMLPYFSSNIINVGCDETYELGKGKSKEICEKKGTGQVYLDFLLKICNIVKRHGKRMMFWGDIIIKYPELISKLPKDVIGLEWGYEADHPFSEDGEKFKKSGIDFYVCPGTSTWNSIAGRTENMKANLLNAAISGKKHGASGYLITDWGDNGHWQYIPFSYPGFVYGAALSWGVDRNANIDIAAYLDNFIFMDEKSSMGNLVMELGNYYLKEKVYEANSCAVVRILYSDFHDLRKVQGYCISDFKEIISFVNSLLAKLDEVQMKCKDASIIFIVFRKVSERQSYISWVIGESRIPGYSIKDRIFIDYRWITGHFYKIWCFHPAFSGFIRQVL